MACAPQDHLLGNFPDVVSVKVAVWTCPVALADTLGCCAVLLAAWASMPPAILTSARVAVITAPTWEALAVVRGVRWYPVLTASRAHEPTMRVYS